MASDQQSSPKKTAGQRPAVLGRAAQDAKPSFQRRNGGARQWPVPSRASAYCTGPDRWPAPGLWLCPAAQEAAIKSWLLLHRACLHSWVQHNRRAKKMGWRGRLGGSKSPQRRPALHRQGPGGQQRPQHCLCPDSSMPTGIRTQHSPLQQRSSCSAENGSAAAQRPRSGREASEFDSRAILAWPWVF